MSKHRVLRVARWLLVIASALAIPAFVLTSLTLDSTPAPRAFNGWATVLAHDKDLRSRIYLHVAPSSPGGYGAHPEVEYRLAVCGDQAFNGVLILAGDARLQHPTASVLASSQVNRTPPLFLSRLTTISMADIGSDSHVVISGVQVFRIKMPAYPCRATPPNAEIDMPRFQGYAITFNGRLEGRTMRPSFAPLHYKPVRQAQSWPLLGQAPMFNEDDLGGFRLGSTLPGVWIRPPQGDFGVDVGLLNGQASVDLARPAPEDAESLTWSSATPVAPKARLTNSDNLSAWQPWSLASGIWLGIGGSILAALALDAVRPKPTPPAAPAVIAAPQKKRAAGRVALDLCVAAVVFGWRRRRP